MGESSKQLWDDFRRSEDFQPDHIRKSLRDYLDADKEDDLPEELYAAIESRADAEDAKSPVQSSSGQFIDSADDIVTYIDKWGNLMGMNPETGARGLIKSAEDIMEESEK